MKINWIILLFFSIVMASCWQQSGPVEYKGDLFPLTTTGENRISFVLNGDVWVPSTDNHIKARVIGAGFPYSFTISASAYHEEGTYEEYGSFEIAGIINEDLLYEPLEKEFHNVFSDGGFYGYIDTCQLVPVRTDELYVNFVKFDRVNNTLSGIFEVPTLYNNCGEAVEILDGRFDVEFN